jgi:hypothetical protein
MRKRLLSTLTLTVMLTGCGPAPEAALEPTEAVSEVQTQPTPQTVAAPENIVITDESSAEVSEEAPIIDNGIVIDAGDAKVLESTIDQITEQLEK